MSQTRIQIFRTGTHTAMDGTEIAFSAADLGATAAAYDPARHEAPIVVGHPRHDGPAYGWVQGLTVENGALVADLDQVEPAFADLVRQGRFKKISAAFYGPRQKGNPNPGVYSLKHVGFLGAAAPAVKGLRQVQFAEEGHLTVELDFAEREAGAFGAIARVLRGIRDLLIGQAGVDATNAAIAPWDIDQLSATAAVMAEEAAPKPLFTEPETPMPDPTPDTTALAAREAELAAREAEIAARAAAVAAQEAAFAEAATARRTAELTTRVDALVAEGKIAPAARADALAFVAEIDGGTVAFAEGAANPADWWLGQVASAEPLIAFGEMAKPDGAKTPVANTPAAIEAAAKKRVAEAKADGRTLSFAAAVRLVEKEMEG